MSLYANVPVSEVVDITTDLIFNYGGFGGMSKKEFKQMLHLAVGDSFFMFHETFYMGGYNPQFLLRCHPCIRFLLSCNKKEFKAALVHGIECVNRYDICKFFHTIVNMIFIGGHLENEYHEFYKFGIICTKRAAQDT
ncbi:hypothetical protein SK128_004387 [Halocaridina rubra]|uniref:Uncharacterized protein n=1 Tax=Halocaridina rubra TaxID=373956 RepID=A0AAN8WF41_HALRR